MRKPSSSFCIINENVSHRQNEAPFWKKKHWCSARKAKRYRGTAHCSLDEGISYWNYEREYFATFSRPKDNTNIQKRLSSDGSFISRSGGRCDWSDGLVIQ